MRRFCRRLASLTLGAAIALVPFGAAQAEPEPAPQASNCARTGTGRRIVCFGVSTTGDWAGATVCTYDDALGMLGWGLSRELTCLNANEDEGYLSQAPGACERSFGSDRPDACVNGRDRCLVWVLSVRIVCRA